MYRPEKVTQVGWDDCADDDDDDNYDDDHDVDDDNDDDDGGTDDDDDDGDYRTDFYSDLSNVSPTDFTSEGSPADSKYASSL